MSDTHRTALARFKFVSTSEDGLRTLELDDQRFVAGNEDNGWQWPAAIRTERGGIPGSTQARPCLTINKVAAPVAQIVNQARAARFAIEVSPKGSHASRETADVFQGLIRHCEVESNAQVARTWAFDRALKCGRGFYRVLTKYANDGDSDLDICTERILNQASVYLDPSAQQPDWSDADWGFITVWLTRERYVRDYPDSELASLDEFPGVGDAAPSWMKGEGDAREYRIAEYFYADYKSVDMLDLADGNRVPLLQAPVGVAVIRRSTKQERTIKWCKLNAVEILDTQDWPGRYIPIVTVLADEFNIDGERIFQGLVRPAKSAQRSYNYMRSAQVEGIGLAPRAPWVGAEGQFEGHPEWDTANTKNYSKLEYVPVSIGGELEPPPARNVVEPAIQAITLAAHEATDDIHATTGVPPISLGQLDPHDRSGKAIKALQNQSDQGSSNYLDNLARAITHEGRIYVDLIPKIYQRPGRVAQLLGTDDEPSQVMLNQPFVPGQDGQPQALPEGQTHPDAKHYDLSTGHYSLVVKVGKSFTTQRDQADAAMGALAEAAPQLVPTFADLWVDTMDFPGAHAIAERLKKTLPPGLQDQPNGPPDPRMQALQGQLQQMQQQMQAMQHYIETKQAEQQGHVLVAKEKAQGEVQIAQAKTAADVHIAQVNNAAKIAVARISAAKSLLDIQAEAAEERLATGLQQQHDVGMAQMAHQHTLEQGAQSAVVGAVAQGADQQHDAAMSDAERQHQAQMAEQAAAQASANGDGA